MALPPFPPPPPLLTTLRRSNAKATAIQAEQRRTTSNRENEVIETTKWRKGNEEKNGEWNGKTEKPRKSNVIVSTMKLASKYTWAQREQTLVTLGNSIRCTCFSPQGQIYNSSLLELKHIKPNPHLTLTLSLIPTLSLTLKPTPSLTLTPPLTLKHYSLKNT